MSAVRRGGDIPVFDQLIFTTPHTPPCRFLTVQMWSSQFVPESPACQCCSNSGDVFVLSNSSSHRHSDHSGCSYGLGTAIFAITKPPGLSSCRALPTWTRKPFPTVKHCSCPPTHVGMISKSRPFLSLRPAWKILPGSHDSISTPRCWCPHCRCCKRLRNVRSGEN